MDLAWAVRISGDGGQEGRHLAKTFFKNVWNVLLVFRRQLCFLALPSVRGPLRERDELLESLAPSPFFFFFLAKCLPSWPPSPEIRTARAKFTDFLIFFFSPAMH